MLQLSKIRDSARRVNDFDVYAEGSYHEVLSKGLVGWQLAKVHKLIEHPLGMSIFRQILEFRG